MALTIPSSSSVVTNNSQKLYDVFLSFRGEDTRYGIASHIYKALAVEKKVETYIDEKSLERGDEISPALLGAIERSKIAVIVFSEYYATSSWCLSELVHINKCRRNLGQIVVPIFYKVDPSSVRKQDQGSYKEAFKKHEKSSKHKGETIREWRAALEAIGSISGSHYKQSDNRPESALVKEIVETILKKLERPVISDDDFKGLIGMKNHFNKLESLLSNGSPKLQILGIWGMPGIGKTTIANAVFSRLFPRFESYYFLRNVREGSEKHGLERLRDELIAKLLRDENINFGILSNSIPEYAKDRLRRTKVLLVLDDVSEKKQLEHLVGDHFGSESRIIVTTRDEGVLRATEIEADFEKYEVELLSFEESLWLFKFTTFKKNFSPPEYEELCLNMVKHMGGNPLAITVFGSHLRSLRNPSKQNWEMELEKLKEFSHDDIQKVLRISYDGLDRIEKKIFLDIACFFKGMSRDFVENVLNGCNFFASTGLDDLIDKSLISMDTQNNKLHMHDLVQQMGWQTVREESEEPCNRSRIWIAEDASHVLNNDKGTSRIEGIFLDTSKLDEDVYLKPVVFQRMDKLRLLKIYEEGVFKLKSRGTTKHKMYVEVLEYFPPSLRYLEWQRFPLKSLPKKFDPRNLVELTMPGSQLEELWYQIQKLDKLKGIDLRYSINLTQIPDLSHSPNLETLNLENCTSLGQFPWDSLQNLNKLLNVNLGGCHKIGYFPDKIDARELKTLNLSGCLNLKTVPSIVSQSIMHLDLSSTDIVNIPWSIGSMSSLTKLSFVSCRLLEKLPSSIAQLNNLKDLSLQKCSSLEMFPELPINIKTFYLSETVIKEVPSSCLEHSSRLTDLGIYDCQTLESLPSNLFGMPALEVLHLEGCSNLKNLPEVPNHARSNLKHLFLSQSGIRYLPSSIGKLTKVEQMKMNGCANLEFVGNLSSFSMSSLENLEMIGCKKLQHLSQLPLSLQYLDAAGCSSLELVMDSSLNSFRSRFWDNPREIKFDTFDYSLYGECLKLDQSAIHNILAEFQLKALDMATHYVAPEKTGTSPAVTTCYPGGEIPDWFDHIFHHYSNDISSPTIVLIPDPAERLCHDLFGFAMCAVVAGKTCGPRSEIYCEIKFRREGVSLGSPDFVSSPFTGTQTSQRFPVLASDHVVMWYKYTDASFHRSSAASDEVSFDFSIQERDGKPCGGVLLKCGVHVLCRNDLVKLGLVDAMPRLLELHEIEESEQSSSLLVASQDNPGLSEARDHGQCPDSFWHKICSALASLLWVCCSRKE